MMSNDENLISDFAAYFTNLGIAIFKEQDSERWKTLKSIISSVKRFFIEVAC